MTSRTKQPAIDDRWGAVRGGAWYHTVEPDVRPSYPLAHGTSESRHVDVCFRTVQSGARQPLGA